MRRGKARSDSSPSTIAALTQEQIVQNFDVGVGEKFFLLFDISDVLQAAPQSSYILFEVAAVRLLCLSVRPAALCHAGRFVADGHPAAGHAHRPQRSGSAGRVRRTRRSTRRSTPRSSANSASRSRCSARSCRSRKGPQDDEFFLTFDTLARTDLRARRRSGARDLADRTWTPHRTSASAPSTKSTQPSRRLRVSTPNTMAVDMTYQELRQSLPAVEDINTFLSSHQVADRAACNRVLQRADQRHDGARQLLPRLQLRGRHRQPPSTRRRQPRPFVDPLIANIVGNGRNGPQLADAAVIRDRVQRARLGYLATAADRTTSSIV